jgi:hypothetical protein
MVGPDVYQSEISAAGPAGTVVAFTPSTLHRGTNLTRPGGARYTMHLGHRPAGTEWAQRYAWTQHSHDSGWYQLVARATPGRGRYRTGTDLRIGPTSAISRADLGDFLVREVQTPAYLHHFARIAA